MTGGAWRDVDKIDKKKKNREGNATVERDGI